MTVEEINAGKLEAAYVLGEIRKCGGIVLLVPRGNQWRIHMPPVGNVHVPSALKYRLIEVRRFAALLLRELCR